MINKNYDLLIIEIANSIKLTRKAKKLTVQELAYRCDMERSNMSRIEAGRTNVTIKTLNLIATALGINLRDLIPE